MIVKVARLPHGEGLELPCYETPLAAGMDLRAAVDENHPIILEKFARALVPTGITLQLQHSFEAQVRPRSGLAFRHGVTVLNAPGTIDADYRGEVKVLLVNFGQEPFQIERGMRIAQLVIAPVVRAIWEERVVLDASQRAEGGFGSTGI